MAENQSHRLVLDGRRHLEIVGVEQVDNFDTEEILLSTNQGKMRLVGEDLHISHLQLEDCQLTVTGKITAIEYLVGGADKKEKGRNLLSRLIK